MSKRLTRWRARPFFWHQNRARRIARIWAAWEIAKTYDPAVRPSASMLGLGEWLPRKASGPGFMGVDRNAEPSELGGWR